MSQSSMDALSETKEVIEGLIVYLEAVRKNEQLPADHQTLRVAEMLAECVSKIETSPASPFSGIPRRQGSSSFARSPWG
ncbi:MAG: hypothetical protein ACJA1E_000863 [Paracoccaceae bacterium]|jgi:hypothetical protein